MACDLLNDISYQKAIIALVGTLFGGFISYFVGVGLYVKKGFYDHAIKFKRAFIDELYAIEREGGNPSKILPKAMKRHDLAVFEFIRVLSRRKRKALSRAWDEYRNPKKQGKVDLTHYYFEGESSEEQENRRKLIIERLSKIISFAE
ncbi:MAG: hypothetical protein VST71_10015 [Nitrospirota bacterium]|nr:hypothetical protein [Nitrospirota bacterium]